MDRRRRPGVPNVRATSLFARTVHKELQRAEYGREEILAFVNELLDLVTDGMRAGRDGGGLTPIVDPETNLPNMNVMVEALDFEFRRVAAAKTRRELLVLVLEFAPPEACADDRIQSFHALLSRVLRERLRPADTFGRIGAGRFLVLLPGARENQALAIAERLAAPLFAETTDAAMRATRATLRSASWSPEVPAPAELLARCLAAPEVEFDPRSTRSTTTKDAPPRPGPPAARRRDSVSVPAEGAATRDIVLALGGGAARAAAHIGVLRALRRGGFHVRGIAGTSAGGLIGAMYLSGMSEDEMTERFESFARSASYRQMRRLYAAYKLRWPTVHLHGRDFRRGGLDFVSDSELAAIPDDLLSAFVEHFVGPDRDISTLSGPFSASATDLVEGRTVNFVFGPLHAGLKASCAAPGLFLPQRDGGRVLIDGSTISEVPTSAARQLAGKTPILAVYLGRPGHRLTEFDTSLQVVARASSLVHTELVREQLRHTPMLITAPVADVAWLDFRRARQTAELGEQALDQVNALLRP